MQNDNEIIEDSVLNVDRLVGYVTKIIGKLSECNNGNKVSSVNNKFVHISIELLKDEESNWIQLTNCSRLDNINGSNIVTLLALLSCEISTTEIDAKSALVHYKTATNNYETIYDLRRMGNVPITTEIICFPHLKEYLSFKFEHNLTKKEIKRFSDVLIEHLNHLHTQYSNVKYTLHAINGELLYTNLVELDHTYTHCQSISSAITRILRLSLNSEFRNECFELLNIDHSEMANDAIMNTLFSLFHHNYQM